MKTNKVSSYFLAIVSPVILWGVGLPFVAGLLATAAIWIFRKPPICVSSLLPITIIAICVGIVVAVNVKIWYREKERSRIAAVIFIVMSILVLPTALDLIAGFFLYSDGVFSTDSQDKIQAYCEKH